jgi:hypothetical protein
MTKDAGDYLRAELSGRYPPESGLVMLIVSFVDLDPKKTSRAPSLDNHKC